MNVEDWLADRVAGLPCRVLLPDPYRPGAERVPLLVSLHGSGERGDDNVAQLLNGLDVFERRTHRCIVVAPQIPAGETFGGSWYGGDTPGQRRVVGLLRDLAGRSSVDPARVYLVGYSMGAIGGWDLLVREPDLFAGAVLIAGDLDVARSAPLASFPVWSVHGGRDEVVRPDAARAFARLVSERGGRARYTEVPDAGHDVWRQAFADPSLWDWLFAQRRGAPG